ncbi:MAG: ATP-binding cassette domain-containing protein, partial [Solirubrobacteraceae bacterium]
MSAAAADAVAGAGGYESPAGAARAAPVAAQGLRIESLRKRFGAVRALEDVTLSARAGEVHALLGENGAGKSTLIKILSGVTRADGGSVSFDGQRLRLGRPAASAAAGVRTVFQELSTIPELTVAENLLFGREPSRAGRVLRRRLREGARELLAALSLERIDPDAIVSALSLGDRQLLEVAKALREPPRLLILDEATSALSSSESEWVLAHARRAAGAGAVVLLITHRLAEVRAVSDSITVLRSGRTVLAGANGQHSDDELITAMLGRRVERLYPQLPEPRPEPALQVRELRVGARVGPVAFEAREGEILGVGGLQGQGQRELLMALAGALPWSGGSARLRGASYHPRHPSDALAARVALVPEDRQREGLLLTHTVRANVTLGALAQVVRHGLLDPRR